MIERQNTTISNGRISGQMVFELSNVSIDDFLKFRGKVRELTGFSGITLSYTQINEKALIIENRLDRHPEEQILVPPAVALPDDAGGARPQTIPPAVRKDPPPVPDQETDNDHEQSKFPSKEKQPYLHRDIRAFMTYEYGKEYGTIINDFRRRFRNSKATDADIRKFYNRVHGVTE